jgi:hypothetical protein
VTATETRKVANQTVGGSVSAGLIKARSKSVWERWKLTGHSQQQRLDLPEPERLNNAREEVLERLRQDRQVLRQHKQIQPVICQAEFDSFPNRARVRVVCFVNVDHQAPAGEVALFFAQPFGRCWVVGQDEAGGDGDADGDYAFDDEEPAPAGDTHVAV